MVQNSSTNPITPGFPTDPLTAVNQSTFLSESEKQEWREWLVTATKEQKDELIDILHSMWKDSQSDAVPKSVSNVGTSSLPSGQASLPAQLPPVGFNPQPQFSGNFQDQSFANYNQQTNQPPQAPQNFSFPQADFSSPQTPQPLPFPQPTFPQQTAQQPYNAQPPTPQFPDFSQSFQNPASANSFPAPGNDFSPLPPVSNQPVNNFQDFNSAPANNSFNPAPFPETLPPAQPSSSFSNDYSSPAPIAPAPKPADNTFDFNSDPFKPAQPTNSQTQPEISQPKPVEFQPQAASSTAVLDRPETAQPILNSKTEPQASADPFLPNPQPSKTPASFKEPVIDLAEKPKYSASKLLTDPDLQAKPAAPAVKPSPSNPLLDDIYEDYLVSQETNQQKVAEFMKGVTQKLTVYDALGAKVDQLEGKISGVNEANLNQSKKITDLQNSTQAKGGASLQEQIDAISYQLKILTEDFESTKARSNQRFTEISQTVATIETDKYGGAGVLKKLTSLEEKIAKLEKKWQENSYRNNSSTSSNQARVNRPQANNQPRPVTKTYAAQPTNQANTSSTAKPTQPVQTSENPAPAQTVQAAQPTPNLDNSQQTQASVQTVTQAPTPQMPAPTNEENDHQNGNVFGLGQINSSDLPEDQTPTKTSNMDLRGIL